MYVYTQQVFLGHKILASGKVLNSLAANTGSSDKWSPAKTIICYNKELPMEPGSPSRCWTALIVTLASGGSLAPQRMSPPLPVTTLPTSGGWSCIPINQHQVL